MIPQLIILKTNIQNQEMLQPLQSTFDQHPDIQKWTIDLEDVDRVLRIESSGKLTEQGLTQLLLDKGYSCEPLPDF